MQFSRCRNGNKIKKTFTHPRRSVEINSTVMQRWNFNILDDVWILYSYKFCGDAILKRLANFWDNVYWLNTHWMSFREMLLTKCFIQSSAVPNVKFYILDLSPKYSFLTWKKYSSYYCHRIVRYNGSALTYTTNSSWIR